MMSGVQLLISARNPAILTPGSLEKTQGGGCWRFPPSTVCHRSQDEQRHFSLMAASCPWSQEWISSGYQPATQRLSIVHSAAKWGLVGAAWVPLCKTESLIA